MLPVKYLTERVVNRYITAGCTACYVSETVRHFCTRVKEHLASDRASHMLQHLKNSEHCRALCRLFSCFGSRLSHFSTQEKRGYSYSERTTRFESTITPC